MYFESANSLFSTWKVWSVDSLMGSRVVEITNISSISSYQTAQLIVPKRHLYPGFYEFEFSVTMENGSDGVQVSGSSSTFIQITRFIYYSLFIKE